MDLEYDYVAAIEKRKEMEELVKSIVENNTTSDVKTVKLSDVQEMSSKITDSLVEITYSEYDDYTSPIRIIPPGGGSGLRVISFRPEKINEGGHSIKPGNIILNWKKLCLLSCESVFPIVAATHTPWLIPFAVLVVCNKSWLLLNIPVSEMDAIVIWTMWKNKDQDDCIEANNVLGLVNEELSTFARPQIDQQKLEMTLRNLEKMKCIEETNENKWHLLEEVKVNY